MTNVQITKILAQRKRVTGVKKAAMTRKLRKLSDGLCDSFRGSDAKNCRGCRIEAALSR